MQKEYRSKVLEIPDISETTEIYWGNWYQNILRIPNNILPQIHLN